MGAGKGKPMFSWRQSAGSDASNQTDQQPSFGRQLDRARRGDEDALGALYRQFLPGVFGYIAARVPDRATAEDLTSEVFLQMVEGISRLRATEEASFAAWILRIARVTVAGYYRKREKHPALVPLTSSSWEEPDEAQGPVDPLRHQHLVADPAFQAEVREEWREVVQAINALTEEQRQVLVSRLIMGYDVKTVGRMLGKKGNAIKALQFRALQSLDRLLRKQRAARQGLPTSTRGRGGPA
jgi:RNA polymerase sigma-70 factor (ECF subfamily)